VATKPSAASSGVIQASFDDATPLIDTTFVVVDLETTGLSPERDRITEVGAVRARGGEVLAELRTFIRPGVPIPAAVTAITGITDADVAHAPDLATVLPTLVDFLGDAVFVAHNAPFDLGFLRAGAERLRLAPLRPRVIDTAVLARRLIRSEVRDVRLATLARHLRVPDAPDHRALNDARATLHVLHALIERAAAYGATSIEDLEQLCGPTGDRSHRRIALVADAPAEPGIYRFLAEDGTVLYVGKATDLRRRLRSYFGQDTRRRTADLVAATARVTWTVLPTEIEAAVREVRELQVSRPRYNRRSTRTDPGTTVTLTREPFPRLAIVRGAPDADTDGLGPIPRSAAERVVRAIESVVALRPCRTRLRRTLGSSCTARADRRHPRALGTPHASGPHNGPADNTRTAPPPRPARSRARLGRWAPRVRRYSRHPPHRSRTEARPRRCAESALRRSHRAVDRTTADRDHPAGWVGGSGPHAVSYCGGGCTRVDGRAPTASGRCRCRRPRVRACPDGMGFGAVRDQCAPAHHHP
jgi:DNA polymerase-3 subunit epsilon